MGLKMNLRITTKNHAAVPSIGFPATFIQKPYVRAKTMPPAWELIIISDKEFQFLKSRTNRFKKVQCYDMIFPLFRGFQFQNEDLMNSNDSFHNVSLANIQTGCF